MDISDNYNINFWIKKQSNVIGLTIIVFEDERMATRTIYDSFARGKHVGIFFMPIDTIVLY